MHLASALKSIALIRLGRKEEASNLVDSLMNKAADNTTILTPLCMALTSLDRPHDEVKMLDAASKASPNSIDIGAKAFTAMIKAKEWQKAQQTSLRLHKLVSTKDKSNDDYFWSSMQAYSLIASDSSLPGSQLALPLAQRMIAKHLESHPIGPRSDEIMFLYITILRKMGKPQREEALRLLNSEERGRELCKRSMTLAMLRYELMEECEDWQTIYDEAITALEEGERNWSRVQEAVKAALHFNSLKDIETRFVKLSEIKTKDRTMKLAPLYLIKAVREAGKANSALSILNLLDIFLSYFKSFSTKACAYEDLAPYVPLLSEQEVQSALQVLQQDAKSPASRSFADMNSLYLNLNACKLARLIQPKVDTTVESELQSGQDFFALYLCAIPLGKDLPKTEMQPADDYALLSAQALVHASVMQREFGDKSASVSFLLAIVILTTALRYSPRGYRLRVLLIQLLRQFGNADIARKEFEEIGIKAIQQDTLGWILASRSSSIISQLKSDSQEEQSYTTAVRKFQTVWKEGRTQVPPMVAKTFASGIFSRVEELVDFGQRLENSLTKWLVAVETARFPKSQMKSDNVTEVLLDCVASLTKTKVSDQQDYQVLLNLMPNSCPSIEALTSLGSPNHPGLNYLKAMMPVAMLHQGLDAENYTSSTPAADDLTDTELSLSQLGAALIKDDAQEISTTSSTLFQSMQASLDAHRVSDVPCKLLCSIGIALEAYKLLTTVDRRREGKLQGEIKSARSFLSTILDKMQTLDWDDTSPVLSKDWTSLLDRLPSALRSGDDGPTLMRKKASELVNGRKNAIDALNGRVESALNAAGQ
jgi:N-terminal acetyltransferase B complex non-catalytic subunit